MNLRPDIARPGAGTRVIGLVALAVWALLASPLAASGHHHEAGTTPDHDAPCSVCLWQAHQAADLVDAHRTATPVAAPLEVAASARYVPAVEPLRPSARAPPFASV
jgi:hypothetical protein